MKGTVGGVVITLIALLILASLSLYVVDQRQNAIVVRLGEIVEVKKAPGLYLKIPLLDTVNFFDTRILTFDSQEAFMHAYKAGHLNRDFIAVIRFQGPRANGMPELHALTPALANLQDAGHHVAMVTDGRMSGASGKVPAAIHVSPEILAGGPLGLVRDGDIIRLDATTGRLDALVPQDVWAARKMATADLTPSHIGMGRELFAMFRNAISAAEQGAATFPLPSPIDTTVPLHEGADSGEIMPGSDEDTLIRNPK